MPTTMSEYKKALRKPPLCELLPVRDYLDGVAVQMDGSFVAGYELDGLNSYYHDDDMRNRSKRAFEALVRSLPERSMRMQVRFEITEGIGDVRKHYPRLNRSENPVLQDIDRIRMQQWDENEEKGFYLRHILHAYFIWNPRTHHEMADRQEGKKRNWFSLSADKCIQRERREHEDLLAEFSSLMAGVEQTLAATGMRIRRMTDDEMFVEAKRSLNPVFEDRGPYRRSEYSIDYRSAREQIVNTSIEDEQEGYIQAGVLDFPVVVNAEVTIPDQTKVISGFKSRMKKMQAAQIDSRGGRMINVDAAVAHSQLNDVLTAVISSSLKVCEYSLVVTIRTSKPVVSRSDLEEAQRELNRRRERVIHAVGRMNGARAIPESLAQRRLFLSSLPGMAGPNQREMSALTLHAADHRDTLARHGAIAAHLA